MRSPTSGACSTLFASEDQKEGMAAFSRSGRPDFRGRWALGNPDRPVGGLAVRAPTGVDLRPLGRDDFPWRSPWRARCTRSAPMTMTTYRAAFDALVDASTRRRSWPSPTASRPA